MRRRPCVDWHDERGQFAGIEAIPFSILVFVVGSLLVANAWAVVDAKFVVTSAAREAARTYVEASDLSTGRLRAEEAAASVVVNHGRSTERFTLDWEPELPPLSRCARVTARAQYDVPAITLPFIGGYGNAFEVTSTHSEIVDPFRDGLDPVGGCG